MSLLQEDDGGELDFKALQEKHYPGKYKVLELFFGAICLYAKKHDNEENYKNVLPRTEHCAKTIEYLFNKIKDMGAIEFFDSFYPKFFLMVEGTKARQNITVYYYSVAPKNNSATLNAHCRAVLCGYL